MIITLHSYWIPILVSVIIFLWCNYGFDYSGDYNFTGLFVLPLSAFLTALTWMTYFAIMYWTKP